VRNLAKHCELTGSVLIHISSDYVYHPLDQNPINETDPCSPQGVYALTKLQGEEEVRRLLARHVIIRTSWVYSEAGHNFVKTMLRLSETKKTLRIVSDQIGSPTYALDLAEVIIKIITGPLHYGTYNFSNLGYISWADFAEEIFKQANKEVEIQRITTEDYPTPAVRPLNSRLIKSKIADHYHISLKYWKYSLTKCLKEIDN
jgi:dTDP-4-dehydrorhamnose reductase